MKTFLTKSKNSMPWLLLLLAFPVWAKPVAQVISVKGQVFVVTPEGKTKTVKSLEHLEEKSEVLVGENSNVTLNDYYDASYSLVEGTHLKFFDKSVLLKKGKTWIQSHNTKHPLSLTTANGHVDYGKGEFISTFDQNTSRSQFLVINGEVEVSNVLEKNMKYTVSAGTFTLVDPEIENGVPRAPTRVGMSSLNEAVAEFKGGPVKVEVPTQSRGIASVSEEAPSVKKGEIIYLKSSRAPASVVGEGAYHYWKKKHQASSQTSHAPIRFFGVSPVAEAKWSATPEVKLRQPASFKPQIKASSATNLGTTPSLDSEFSETFRKQKDNQPKYSKELENLIQDLKSF